jgi:hypothetical protein
VLEDALGGGRAPEGLTADDPGRLRLAAAYADLLRAQGDDEGADLWAAALAVADEDDVADTGRGPEVLFSEEELEEPVDAESLTDEEAGVEEATVEEATVEEASDEEADVDGLDLDDDIEAEVAELLGEDHPLAHPQDGPRSTGD